MFIKSLDMILEITNTRSIRDVQQEFNGEYPFLKIEFYKANHNNHHHSIGASKRQHLISSLAIKNAGLIKDGTIEINDLMTVGQLENIFHSEFGLSAQVSRKSGILWLETTMTDNWTLKQQNEHGKELSEPVRKYKGDED
jgi:hypothetical protein